MKFHNGEEFDAEAVRVNWEAYRKMESPRPYRFTMLSGDTKLAIVDRWTVRFIFSEVAKRLEKHDFGIKPSTDMKR